jgi:hypothetical protein
MGNAAHRQGDYATACAFYEKSLTIRRELGDERGVIECLEGFAHAACAQGQGERAAQLFGAAEALREAIGAPLPSIDRADYDRSVAAARVVLGEEAFLAAWAAGRAMTMEQAVAYALEEGKS